MPRLNNFIGSGSGSGSGSGYGDGSGYGSGYGYGFGYGDGSGYGDGFGYGDGSGYGSGDGSGSGDGFGYGDGDGDSLFYWEQIARKFVCNLATNVFVAFWKSDKSGRPCNGGSSSPVEIGQIQKASGPLNLCHANTLHATLNPAKWKGDRLWIVAMHGEIQQDGDKVGALVREIVAEVI